MRRLHLVAIGLCAVLACATAEAQATYETSAAAPAASDVRGYPSFSLGARLELFAVPLGVTGGGAQLPQFSYPMALELILDITSRVSLFAGLGTYMYVHTEDDGDLDYKNNYGIIMIQGGLRFNLIEPRPQHAHLYLGMDVTGALAFATDEIDGEADDDAEDATKEYLDHLLWGVGLGMEYLLAPEFGIGGEIGFRFMFNKLEDTVDDFDKFYSAQIFTYFGLRMVYHF
jgi:hypothetical protein